MKLAADFYGNIPAIGVIHQVFHRHQQVVRGCAWICTVKMIIDGDKTYSHKGKYLFDVFSRFDKIPSQAGKILDNDTVDLLIPDGIHHIHKSRTLKIHPGVPVIRLHFVQPDLRMRPQKIHKQIPLVGNTVTFGLVAILTGKTQIQICLIQYLTVFLHGINSYSV